MHLFLTIIAAFMLRLNDSCHGTGLDDEPVSLASYDYILVVAFIVLVSTHSDRNLPF